MLSDADGTYPHGSTGIEQIAHLQRHEPTHIGYNPVYGKQHVAGATTLHRVPVNVEVETDVLNVLEILHRDKRTDDGGIVESLAQLPRIARFSKTALQVTCRKVDAHGDGIIVTVCKAFGDVLAQTTDAHDQLRLVMNLIGEIGDKNGLPSLSKAESGFRKITGSLGSAMPACNS